MVKHETLNEVEVVALEGVETVRLIINGTAFAMSPAVANLIAKDLKSAVKRIGGK